MWTDIDCFEYCNDENVQLRVPPAHDHSRQVRPRDVDWPENAHQPIILGHDSQPKGAETASLE